MKLYSIYDEKAYYYRPPFYCVSDDEAKRVLIDALRDDGGLLSTYAEDFTLYGFGDFDQSTGEFDILSKPCFVAKLSELRIVRPPVGGVELA